MPEDHEGLERHASHQICIGAMTKSHLGTHLKWAWKGQGENAILLHWWWWEVVSVINQVGKNLAWKQIQHEEDNDMSTQVVETISRYEYSAQFQNF